MAGLDVIQHALTACCTVLACCPMQEARDSISEYQASRAAAEEQQREAERAPVREVRQAWLMLWWKSIDACALCCVCCIAPVLDMKLVAILSFVMHGCTPACIL
jgi:hypothetical protein